MRTLDPIVNRPTSAGGARIRQWMKKRARKAGKEVSYKIGSLEILLICEAIDKGLDDWLKKYGKMNEFF